MKPNRRDDRYQFEVDLAEIKLLQRLRQLRARGDHQILLIRSTDCRELGKLPVKTDLPKK